MSVSEALKKGVAVDRLMVVKGKRFKIVEYPDGELSVGELNTYIDNLEYYENFVADVVVIDSPDNMRYEGVKEFRHGINSIWKGCKGLAQKRHCLTVVSSQGNTMRTGKDLKRGDWSEDIRKYHVLDVGMIINQNNLEKDRMIYRCLVAKQRHEEFSIVNEIMVLSALHIGRPYISSYKMPFIKK